MRTIMISDIHGCLDELIGLLHAVEYSPVRDKLVLLGDYVDRGPKSKEVVEQIMQLVNEHGAIAIKGNHDQRLADLIHNRDVKEKFIEHGGLETITSYTNSKDFTLEEAMEFIRDNYIDHIHFLSSLPLYYEDQDHIYVHAGINPSVADWRLTSKHDFLYIKELFIRNKTTVKDRKIVFGHTKTIDIHGTPDVWFSDDKIGIDGGCAYGLQLNALIFNGTKYENFSIRRLTLYKKEMR